MTGIAFRAVLAAAPLIAATPASPPADQWDIGPVIGWRNYTKGMPPHPTPLKTGWTFAFPNPTVKAGHVHYLTFRHGPLTGKKRITLRYRIDAAAGVRFVPQEQPQSRATLSLFFQRRGDNWRAKGRYAQYRWYAPDAKVVPIVAGTTEISIALNDPDWIPVMGGRAADFPADFAAAIANADRVGFVLGSDAGRGHGVFATSPARFTLLDFRVE